MIQDPKNGTTLHTQITLRQQTKKVAGQPNIALADFIAPQDSQMQDYIGAFVVTAGLGIEKYIAQFEANHDDYNSIMVKALADRLAESFAVEVPGLEEWCPVYVGDERFYGWFVELNT